VKPAEHYTKETASRFVLLTRNTLIPTPSLSYINTSTLTESETQPSVAFTLVPCSELLLAQEHKCGVGRKLDVEGTKSFEQGHGTFLPNSLGNTV